jgi:hypothetical protein
MENVLVCVLAKTRAHELTFSSFKRRVLDELGADLALALTIDEKYDYANPFWQQAKYRWTAPDFSDYGKAFDLAQRWLCLQHSLPSPDWRLMLQIKGIWQGGIQSPDPQPSASSVLPFCRWLLLQGLQRDAVLDRYDRFVITRSDFVWLCPHPPLSILDPDAIWFPNGEHYGGVNDRHLVASRADVVNCLNGIEDILLHPAELYQEMKHHAGWNDEQLLAHHLTRNGLLPKTKYFPYVMYTARAVRDEGPTWSRGRYEPTVGHFVKYENEFRAAIAFSTVISSAADWEGGSWRQFDPATMLPPPISFSRRIWYGCQRVGLRVLSALNRPRRVARLGRFLKTIARQ